MGCNSPRCPARTARCLLGTVVSTSNPACPSRAPRPPSRPDLYKISLVSRYQLSVGHPFTDRAVSRPRSACSLFMLCRRRRGTGVMSTACNRASRALSRAIRAGRAFGTLGGTLGSSGTGRVGRYLPVPRMDVTWSFGPVQGVRMDLSCAHNPQVAAEGRMPTGRPGAEGGRDGIFSRTRHAR